ncbi:MAG: DUF3737 family protein [Ruminococcaceae bacterium]|nr:DUF3737 family protein [Oscillospiraceae bacterium]
MKYENKTYGEERALYGIKDSKVIGCIFDGEEDGESALKECRNIEVENCYFNLRYPLWHVDDAKIKKAEMTEKCRAALWYDSDIRIESSKLNGIKALRECEGVTLSECEINSEEFGWRCRGLYVENCTLNSQYPFFECKDMNVDGLSLTGKYSFQYIENSTFRNCVFKTKDAFWHAKNVTVYDSVIAGEYLAWYSENLRLVRCKISGTQPLCYCKGLVLEDCEMEGTDLSFERSDVRATVIGSIDSVKNPVSGFIRADGIGEVILEEEFKDVSVCKIEDFCH